MDHPKNHSLFGLGLPGHHFLEAHGISSFISFTVTYSLIFILIPDIEPFQKRHVSQKRSDKFYAVLHNSGGVVLPPGGSSNTPASWCPWAGPRRGQEGFTQPAAGGGVFWWVGMGRFEAPEI